ncbi:hypothetical protein EOT10_38850 [Streptomyces antnestii]|uniref:Uncharacterized protein n=1 Tax=Streptomyces antnestii TaxID=2494256 RepID=A0A3S2XIB6_9ACTN|nr:hypothetical protein [Streptomyces sp. San01]RVU15546.1 hypothetical protein EOT10_38850 [Streptomyces sp. San01]
MSRHLDLQAEFRTEVTVAFSFLFEEAGFTHPVTTESQLFSGTGLLFRGAGLDVEVQLYDGREPEVVTRLEVVGPDGARVRRAALDELYVAAGCGPPQDVPGQAPNRRSTLKRVGQHATALRRLMSRLPGSELSQLIIRHTALRREQ